MELQYKKSLLIELLFASVVAGIIYISVKFLFGYLLPFVLASVIAYLSQAPAKRIYRSLHISKGVCSALISCLLILLFLALIVAPLYFIAIAIRKYLGDFSDFFEFVTDFVFSIQKSFFGVLRELSPTLEKEVSILAENFIVTVRESLGTAFSGLASGIARKMPSFLLGLVVTLVASCYIAKDFDGLLRFIKELLGNKVYGNTIKIKEILCGSVFKLLKGYLILALITFAELTVGLLFLRISYAPILASLIALVDLLPVLGTGTVLVPWGIGKMIAGEFGTGIYLIVLYVVIVLVRNFLEPKIIGHQIGINPLFTLVAMFGGLKLFGFWGLFICPIVLIVIIKYYKKEMQEESD